MADFSWFYWIFSKKFWDSNFRQATPSFFDVLSISLFTVTLPLDVVWVITCSWKASLNKSRRGHGFVLFFDLLRWKFCYFSVQVIKTKLCVLYKERPYRQAIRHNFQYWAQLNLSSFNAGCLWRQLKDFIQVQCRILVLHVGICF
jgi:hypothetical protein